MKELNWSAFEKNIYINSSVESIYNLWSTKEGITKWFLKDAIYTRNGHKISDQEPIQAGDAYTWKWHNWDGQEDGKVLEANGKDQLSFSFANSQLTINFKRINNVVIVELKQYDIPQDNDSKLKIYCGCSNGWTFWLTNLKAYLEHGILLNETEIDLSKNELSEYTFVNM